MNEALKQAKIAFEEGEIPVGAVIVCQDQIIARAYNQVERLKDATAHAEMIAITSAAAFMNSKYLNECSLYVTLEPCQMCNGAISESHIGKVYFGALNNLKVKRKSIEMVGGLMQDDCKELIDEFFRQLRT